MFLVRGGVATSVLGLTEFCVIIPLGVTRQSTMLNKTRQPLCLFAQRARSSLIVKASDKNGVKAAIMNGEGAVRRRDRLTLAGDPAPPCARKNDSEGIASFPVCSLYQTLGRQEKTIVRRSV